MGEKVKIGGAISRRALVGGGLGLLAVGAGMGLVGRRWRQVVAGAAPAGVFRRGSPTRELFELWRGRGWAREARHYLVLGKNLQCKLCPNECLLEPEDRSHCRNKVHKEGKLYTLAYGNPCSVHVDPIEKKPLFHFWPGARAFSLATAGCNLRCLNCQNWEISQKTPEETKDLAGPELRARPEQLRQLGQDEIPRVTMLPDDVVRMAQATGSEAIAYTYSEPISYFEYMLDTARIARQQGLKNLWITNGFIQREPLLELSEVVDGANVNLKSYREEIYARLNQAKLAPVLATLRTLKERGVWFEITNLVVPTYTDDLGMIREMCGWISHHLGPEQPLHLSRFHPQYKLDHLPPTPIDILLRAREAARSEGLKHVYIGNVHGVEGAETTNCASCGKALVERTAFRVEALHVSQGRCQFCGTRVAGVWRT
jgi:pyruvate formate lyase activating enzyme